MVAFRYPSGGKSFSFSGNEFLGSEDVEVIETRVSRCLKDKHVPYSRNKHGVGF